MKQLSKQLKQSSQPQIKERKEKEPCILLRIIKSSVNLETIQTQFAITSRGMLNSQRTDQGTGDITIGRQQVTDKGQRPNDIILAPSDRAISRTHCKILYQNGFSQQCPEEFLAFLLARNKRLGKKSIASKLPKCLFQEIYKFLQPQRKFYIVDLGTIYGTYIRAREKMIPQKGATYLIGPNTTFNVIEV